MDIKLHPPVFINHLHRFLFRFLLRYEGISENKKWSRIETYGPKLVENIVQGTARDLLAEAMLRVEKKGYPIVMHCHDEIIAEVPEGIQK